MKLFLFCILIQEARVEIELVSVHFVRWHLHLCLLYSGYSPSPFPSIPPILLLRLSLLLPSLGTGLWVLFMVTLGLELCIVCSGSQLKTLDSPSLNSSNSPSFCSYLFPRAPFPIAAFHRSSLLLAWVRGQGSSFAVPVLSRHAQANSGI